MSKNTRITITGTKGKTTVSTVLADVLQGPFKTVLKVDSNGHYVNGKQRSTLKDSKETYGLVTTVCPGKYLYEVRGKKNAIAVLEASVGSSSLPGLGYSHHNVGVFLNVMEDHIGSSNRLKTKDDIRVAKQFIFQRLNTLGGTAVFNADDPQVVKALDALPKDGEFKKVPFGLDFTHYNLDSHLKSGGIAITIKGDDLVLLEAQTEQKLLAVSKVSWTFENNFLPSSYNLMAIAAALCGLSLQGKLKLNKKLWEKLQSHVLPERDGRLTYYKNKSDIKIIADYAHEKYSLKEVALLAKKLTSNNGSVIGVLRLAYDRTDKLIKETGKFIAPSYDQFIIYDKIDGYWRHPKKDLQFKRFPQKVGYTSSVFSKAIDEAGAAVQRIIREDKAIQYAAEVAKPGDVVVCIVNDDIDQSLKFIKKSFKVKK